MKIIIFTIILSASINVGFAQPKLKANTLRIENVKFPHFTNGEVMIYFKNFRRSLGDLLIAVRQNNRKAIWHSYDSFMEDNEETYRHLQIASETGQTEHQMALDYLKQLRPFITEISKHPYVKDLNEEYLAKHPKNN